MVRVTFGPMNGTPATPPPPPPPDVTLTDESNPLALADVPQMISLDAIVNPSGGPKVVVLTVRQPGLTLSVKMNADTARQVASLLTAAAGRCTGLILPGQ